MVEAKLNHREMKTPGVAACFATYILPHVLFVDDFDKRRRVALI